MASKKVINNVAKSGKKCIKVGILYYIYIIIFIMSTFIGDTDSKIDSKGRFLFPAAYKKQMKAEEGEIKFVVKKSLYKKCLELYPISEWEIHVDKLRKRLNPYNRKHSEFITEFYRNTAEVGLESNGRILLPKRLLEISGINKDIILTGVGPIIEIWSEDVYNSSQMNEEAFENLAEEILGSNENSINL